MISFCFFWQDWFQHAHLNLVQQIEKHMVTHFSVLDLTMVYDNGYERSMMHVFGPSVLHLLGMHPIRTATRRLQINFRPEVIFCSAYVHLKLHIYMVLV
jgi:hypothetical protein